MAVTQIPVNLGNDLFSTNFLVVLALLFPLFFIETTNQISVFFGDGLIAHEYPHVIQQAEGVVLIKFSLDLLFLCF